MLLMCRDDFARYRIACPPEAQVKKDQEGTDFLVVPDPALDEEVLVAAGPHLDGTILGEHQARVANHTRSGRARLEAHFGLAMHDQPVAAL